MKIIIAGSRTIKDYSLVSEIIQDQKDLTEIVSGMAPGVDMCAAKYGYANGVPVAEFEAEWRPLGHYNPKAGFQRNTRMAEYADKLIAIWDGESRGTAHMISEMKKRNKPVEIIIIR